MRNIANYLFKEGYLIRWSHFPIYFYHVCWVPWTYINFASSQCRMDIGIRLNKVCLNIPYLMFVDDYIFCKATKKIVREVKYILDHITRFQVLLLTIINLLFSSLLKLKKASNQKLRIFFKFKHGSIGSYLVCYSIDQQPSK